MVDPIITEAGSMKKLFLITDHHGMAHRIPKTALCVVANSSNKRVSRLDICFSSNEINLIFESPEKLNTFLNDLDSLY